MSFYNLDGNFDYFDNEPKESLLEKSLDEFDENIRGENDYYPSSNNQTIENTNKHDNFYQKEMKKLLKIIQGDNSTINDLNINSCNSFSIDNEDNKIGPNFNAQNYSQNYNILIKKGIVEPNSNIKDSGENPNSIINKSSVKEHKVEHNSNPQDFSNNSNHIVNNISDTNNKIINESNESNQNNKSNESNESNNSKISFITWIEKRNEHIIKAINPFMINKVIIPYANELIENHNIDDENKRIKKEKQVGLKREYTANTQVKYTKLLLKKRIRDIIINQISGKFRKKKMSNEKIIKNYDIKNPVEEIQKLFNTEFQDFFYYIMAPNDPNDPIRTRIKKIYEEQLNKKIEKNQKTIKDNIKNFVEMINDRKEKGTK